MKTFEISRFSPCKLALEFRSNYSSFEEAWNNCPRGEWMLWIAQKLNVDLLRLTTAKALCANTVRHLMTDKRSTDAIDVALAFGRGEITQKELKIAAADTAAYAAVANAANAAYAAYAAYAAANAAADAVANAAYADAADAAYAAYAAANAAKIENRLQTANICREILTDVVFDAINNLKS